MERSFNLGPQDLEGIYPGSRGDHELPDLIITIIPQESRPIRYEIKRYGDVVQGVRTQCVVRVKMC